MTFGHIRFIKWSLFFLLIACSVYVGGYVLEGIRARADRIVEPIDEPASLTSRQVEIEQLDSEGEVAWTLNAAESVGQSENGQKFRDVEIRFDAGRDEIPVVVTADECEIEADSSVHLRGDVVVVDDTTIRLEAEVLEFRRFPDRVWSDEPVRYSKQGLRGTAGRMNYVIKRGALDLGQGVDMTLQEDESAPPVHITSRNARMRRNRHWVQYVDDVVVVQGKRRLASNDLELYLDEHNEVITRIEAYEKVRLELEANADPATGATGAALFGAALTAEPGYKRLTTDRLEITFREGGRELDVVRALEGGELELRLPPGSVAGYDKTLSGNTLAFDFNEQSVLKQARGRGGVVMTLTPRGPKGAPPGETRIVRSRQMESDFDPTTGDLLEARCDRAVEFEQGEVRATSEYAVFRARDSRLELTESPRIWDSRAKLSANRIEVDMDSGDLVGEGDVRSSTSEASRSTGLFQADEAAAVHFVAERVEYDRALDIAVYSGGARGFKGSNRVEADSIEILQASGDLVATGAVRSVFHKPLLETGTESSKASGPTVTRSESLHYRSQSDSLEYRTNVEMRTDGMTLSAAGVDVALGEEGAGLTSLEADGEVAIEMPEGRAAGDHARYLPDDQSMTITGERAWLENSGKVSEGKQLTFFLTDDRILVDGQEQNRTKTTYSSSPR